VAFVGQSTLLGALATLGLTALTFYTFSSHTFTSGSAPVGQLGGRADRVRRKPWLVRHDWLARLHAQRADNA